MKVLIFTFLLVCISALFLLFVQRNQQPPDAHDTHTGILKGSPYDCELDDLHPALPRAGAMIMALTIVVALGIAITTAGLVLHRRAERLNYNNRDSK